MELCTLASGSSGNAVLVFDNDTALLFDAGISAKRICDGLKQLGLSAGQLDGICITHSHSDHISGLRVLLKRTDANDLRHRPDRRAPWSGRWKARLNGSRSSIRRKNFSSGDLSVQAFNTPHDAPGSVGYTVSNRRTQVLHRDRSGLCHRGGTGEHSAAPSWLWSRPIMM